MIHLHAIQKTTYTEQQLTHFYWIKYMYPQASKIHITNDVRVEFYHHESSWDYFFDDFINKHLEKASQADIAWAEARLVS